MERSLANLEKQNAQLQQELDAVLVEKQGLECQIQRLDRKSEETKSNMVILQTEIDIRKSEVVSEHKTNEALSQRNQELCDLVEKCIINIEVSDFDCSVVSGEGRGEGREGRRGIVLNFVDVRHGRLRMS